LIYITGDCHGDWSKLMYGTTPFLKSLTSDDYIIVCGDFGLWHDNPSEQWWFKVLTRKPYNILFVDGNHENYDRLNNEFETVEYHNGMAHKIADNIYHLMRGYMFNINGKKIFAFGGASSHDISDGILDPNDYDTDRGLRDKVALLKSENKYLFRIKGISWWEQELPTESEMEFGLQTLKRYGDKADIIISHCAPQSIASAISKQIWNTPELEYAPDSLTEFFDRLKDDIEFDDWYFGHYHIDSDFQNKFHAMYHSFAEVI